MKVFIQICLALLMVCTVPAAVFAASDGSLGPSSTGSANISITIASRVRISGIDDLNLGTFSGTGNMTKNDDVCIYTNVSGGRYHVKAWGSVPDGSFALQSGPTKTVPYLVSWNHQPGISGNIPLSPGVASVTQTGANTQSSTCSGTSSANFQVTIPEKNLLDVEDGFYSGTLTFLVEPN